MNSSKYIFAVLFILSTFISAAANPKLPRNKTQVALRTEILSLIDEDAAQETDRNLTFALAKIDTNYLDELIAENADQEQNTVLDQVSMQATPANAVKMENLYETNALQEANSQLVTTKLVVDKNFLQTMIEANAAHVASNNLEK